MDRLSELPDSIIFHVFSWLPMSDVVRTTVLSKRWKNLWTTVPYLNFDDYGTTWSSYHKFINEAIKCWRGIKILKLEIKLNWIPFFLDVRSWVGFAVEKKVQELNLELSFARLMVPQCLYSCSSLEELSLESCRLIMYGHVNVQWSQLKSLNIKRFKATEEAIEQVLCGSPQLEVFSLTLDNSNGNLSIRSSSLKKLSIRNVSNAGREMRIWTPNLETLEISGAPCGTCWVMNASSLTRATIEFDHLRSSHCSLRHLLPTIKHVERLTLSDTCIKALGDQENGYVMDVKFLELNGSYKEYKEIVNILEVFPQLQILVLKIEKHNINNFDMFERNLPISFLVELRRVEVTWINKDNSMFPLIEILLKFASKLEKMVIRERRAKPRAQPPWKCLFSASQKLLRLPRSSANCRVDLMFSSKINVCLEEECEEVVDFLDVFTELKMLVLQSKIKCYDAEHAEICLEFETNLPYSSYSSFLLEVRTVEITWANGDKLSMFPLIEILLKYASNLEKMVLRDSPLMPRKRMPWKSFFLASQKLLKIPRSSPTAELIFL